MDVCYLNVEYPYVRSSYGYMIYDINYPSVRSSDGRLIFEYRISIWEYPSRMSSDGRLIIEYGVSIRKMVKTAVWHMNIEYPSECDQMDI